MRQFIQEIRASFETPGQVMALVFIIIWAAALGISMGLAR